MTKVVLTLKMSVFTPVVPEPVLVAVQIMCPGQPDELIDTTLNQHREDSMLYSRSCRHLGYVGWGN